MQVHAEDWNLLAKKAIVSITPEESDAVSEWSGPPEGSDIISFPCQAGGQNNVDFNKAINGDCVVVHDEVNCNTPYGFFRHVGLFDIGNYNSGDAPVWSSWTDGVWVHTIKEVHEYDLAVILRVDTANETRTAAVNYARQQARKPYNYNWLDKYRQDKFYCSQLVWASYYWTANIDLDSNGGLAVSPDNLFWDNNAYSVAIGF